MKTSVLFLVWFLFKCELHGLHLAAKRCLKNDGSMAYPWRENPLLIGLHIYNGSSKHDFWLLCSALCSASKITKYCSGFKLLVSHHRTCIQYIIGESCVCIGLFCMQSADFQKNHFRRLISFLAVVLATFTSSLVNMLPVVLSLWAHLGYTVGFLPVFLPRFFGCVLFNLSYDATALCSYNTTHVYVYADFWNHRVAFLCT